MQKTDRDQQAKKTQIPFHKQQRYSIYNTCLILKHGCLSQELINMTEHLSEITFMSYIGKDQNRDRYADEFMQGMSTIEMK